MGKQACVRTLRMHGRWSMLLAWLRRWRRGDFGRAVPNRKAGGAGEERHVWWWGEELWINALDDEIPVSSGHKAGGGEESGSTPRRGASLALNAPGSSG